ncbi:hypothetical protein KC685_01945 [Candidatus Dojkabacteria bacterium]|uniref:Uncharacterized protein n=1 Tax=Candidatus Dojkabacteria bacterium TaxID=2099670 RepID=A0A955I1F2_9BACT|nr:hypothetical protein [Candidatus Dojkabacteria bacterium]
MRSIKNNALGTLLTLLVLAIVVFSMNPGSFYATGDNYSPEMNPGMVISRAINSPSINLYRALGVVNDSEQADIFRSMFYYIGDLFLPASVLSQLLAFSMLAIGSLSVKSLVDRIARQRNIHVGPFPGFVGGVIYISTLWVVWIFNYPIMPYVVSFGLVPLLSLLIFRYITSETRPFRSLVQLLLICILFSATAVVSTVFIVSIGIFLIVGIYAWQLSRVSTSFKRLIAGISLLFLVNAFWIVPFSRYVVVGSGNVIESSFNKAITTTTIESEKAIMNLGNSVRMYTRHMELAENDKGEGTIFADASNYSKDKYNSLIGYLPIVLSLTGLALLFYYKEKKDLWLWVGLLGFLYLLKNLNPPLEFIYKFLQENVAIFRQVFRWPTSKFGGGYTFFLTLTSGVTVGYLTILARENIHSKKIRTSLGLMLFALFMLSTLSYARFLYNGNLIAERSFANIPQDYFELQNYLEGDPNGRILILPPSNNGYFREYSDGFIGSGFLHYIIPNPILEKSLALISQPSMEALESIERDYWSADFEAISDKLNKYDIKYVLVDENLIEGRYGFSFDASEAHNYVDDLNEVWRSGNLTLYENPDIDVLESYYATSEGPKPYISHNYASSIALTPEVQPLLDTYGAYELQRDHIVSTISAMSETSNTYSYDFERIDLDALPTSVRYRASDRSIIMEPSFPYLEGHKPQLPRKVIYLDSQYSRYITLDRYVIELSQILNSERTYDIPFGTVTSVGEVYDNSEPITYTYELRRQNVEDCSGRESTAISSDEISGGFRLSSKDALACLYTKIESIREESVIEVSLEWDSEPDVVVGYCIWSVEDERCLNFDRFIYSGVAEGVIREAIPVKLLPDNEYSLNVYLMSKGTTTQIADFKSVVLETFTDRKDHNVADSGQLINPPFESVLNGSKVRIPVINGLSSYVYRPGEVHIWDYSFEKSGNITDQYVGIGSGLEHLADENFIYQYTNAFTEAGGYDYMLYWDGENFSGVPAFLSLNKPNDDKAWLEQYFDSMNRLRDVRYFKYDDLSENLDISYRSYGISSITENTLHSVVVQPVPQGWQRLSIEAVEKDPLIESRARNIATSSTGGVFAFDPSRRIGNDILTIPYTSDTGWVTYSIDSNKQIESFPDWYKQIYIALKGDRLDLDDVQLNGWKQGWDLTDWDGSEENIYIIYTPNLLSYIGYGILILTACTVLSAYINEVRKDGKTK